MRYLLFFLVLITGCRSIQRWDEEGRKGEQQKALQDKERNIERIVGPFDDKRQENN
jgi:hypothetical protein